MTPKEIRGLEPGQWITFTPTIFSEGIDGRIEEFNPDGTFYVIWDDDHRSIMKLSQLHSSKFQLKEST
jgi:hypothetical protein